MFLLSLPKRGCEIRAAVHLALQTLQSICSTDMTGPFDVSERSQQLFVDYIINTSSFLLPFRSNCLTLEGELAGVSVHVAIVAFGTVMHQSEHSVWSVMFGEHLKETSRSQPRQSKFHTAASSKQRALHSALRISQSVID